jgi:NAD(P)-dependent dehydrogenase (short-subunit alcohol dehydrogenase family)
MSQPFKDKVAFVTGGASGIGRVASLALSKEGANVVVTDVSEKGGQETVHLIEQQGGKAVFVKADVTKTDEVQAAVETASKRFGRLDFALNNAGVDGVRARLADYPEEVWHQVLNINLTGVFLCMKHEIPLISKQNRGSIVNISSVAGVTGFPGHAAYTASKHGVVGLTRNAALDYAKVGIRVNAICPAYSRTPMVDRMFAENPDFEAKLISRVPLRRLGTPEEIAQAVIYLFSEAASFITGHALMMDGGIMAE